MIQYVAHPDSRSAMDWLRSQLAESTVVVPTDGLAAELRQAGATVITGEALLDGVLLLSLNQLVLGDAERRLVFREIILKNPERYSSIIGRDPDGQLFVTHAMLARLCRLAAQTKKAPVAGNSDSQQIRQFSTLLQDYDAYLSEVSAVDRDPAIGTILKEWTPEKLAMHLSLKGQVVAFGYHGLPPLLKLVFEHLAHKIKVVVVSVNSAASASSKPVYGLAAHSKVVEVREIARAVAARLDDHPGQKILVSFPSLDEYGTLSADMFRDFQVTSHVERATALRSTPLWSLLHYLRDVAVSGFSYSSIRQLAKSPLLHCDGIRLTGSALDDIRRATGFSGYADQFIVQIDKLRKKLEAKLQDLRQVDESDEQQAVLIDKRLGQANRAHAFLTALVRITKPLLQQRELREWPDVLRNLVQECCNCIADDAVSAHNEHAIRILHEAAARIAYCDAILASSKASYPQLVGLLDLYSRDIKLPEAAPGNVDVRITSIEAASSGYNCDFLIVGGLVEGSFPRLGRTQEAWISALIPTTNRVAADLERQRDQLNRLIGGAREVLLTWPQSEGSEELLPSQYLDDIRFEPFVAPESAPDALSEQLAQVMNSPEGIPEHADLSDAARDNIAWCIAANAERVRTDGMGGFDGFVSDLALRSWLKIFAERQLWSPSQLDSLVQCRFRYFMERIVGLKEIEDEEEGISPIIVGEAAHGALCRFYTRWREKDGGLITQAKRDKAATILLEEARFEAGNLKQQLSEFDRQWLYQRLTGYGGDDTFLNGVLPAGGVRGHVGILGAFLTLEIERADTNPNLLQPAYFEVEFGSGRSEKSASALSSREPVRVQMGSEAVRLRGRIDRVDVAENAFALIDYKTGSPPTIESQKLGYRVQIPVYLMAAEQLFERLKQPRVPAGGLYYAVTHKGAEIKGRFFREQFRGLEAMSKRQNAMSEVQYYEAMELVEGRIAGGIQGIRKGEFHITIAKEKHACGYCRTATICRKDLLRAHLLVPLVTANGNNGSNG